LFEKGNSLIILILSRQKVKSIAYFCALNFNLERDVPGLA